MFAVRIVTLFVSLPKWEEAQVIGRQLLRSGTSVGAHYREASRVQSSAEFISKISVGLQELDESAYWMELLIEANIVSQTLLADLMQESNELMAILNASLRIARQNKDR